MNAAQTITEKFGGQTALASLLGKGQSTVQHWAKAGMIPAKWHGEILRLARTKGIELQPIDFINIPGNENQEMAANSRKFQWPDGRSRLPRTCSQGT